jgi:NitT/TauT family transport system permease protein
MVRRAIARISVVVVSVGIWWLAASVFWSSNPVLSNIGPVDSLCALWNGIREGDLVSDLGSSLMRLLIGLAIAFCVGLPVGLALGSNRLLEDASAPVVNFLRMISPLAWAPIVIVAFGIGDVPVLFLIAITAIWPIALGTAAGVKAVSPGLKELAESLGASRRERLRFVTSPVVKANVLTSLRLALGVAWIVLVPAEMLGVDSGLGYAILNARDQLDYAALGGGVLLIGITGFLIDALFRRIFRVDPRISL